LIFLRALFGRGIISPVLLGAAEVLVALPGLGAADL